MAKIALALERALHRRQTRGEPGRAAANVIASGDGWRVADDAGVSPYHFLRIFERLTGATPHQYVLRARLREAALQLLSEGDTILDVALRCGFGDVSNFNRAFRTEFGCSPRAYRQRSR